jgi:hypothetical protein
VGRCNFSPQFCNIASYGEVRGKKVMDMQLRIFKLDFCSSATLGRIRIRILCHLELIFLFISGFWSQLSESRSCWELRNCWSPTLKVRNRSFFIVWTSSVDCANADIQLRSNNWDMQTCIFGATHLSQVADSKLRLRICIVEQHFFQNSVVEFLPSSCGIVLGDKKNKLWAPTSGIVSARHDPSSLRGNFYVLQKNDIVALCRLELHSCLSVAPPPLQIRGKKVTKIFRQREISYLLLDFQNISPAQTSLLEVLQVWSFLLIRNYFTKTSASSSTIRSRSTW